MSEQEQAFIRTLIRPLRVTPGRRITLPGDFDPGDTGGFRHPEEAAAHLDAGIHLLADLQDRLAAQSTYALLVVLQGIDASGKDGTIKHVMTGVNPAGVRVTGFKVPSEEELRHDWLWRYQRALPERGTLGIFNRSHYEEVLVVRVHPELLQRQRLSPEDVRGDIWKRRFEAINHWEHHPVGSGFRVLKVFLNLSRAEQRRRFLQRIDDPRKNWKFSAADIRERHFWDAYQHAYSAMLSNTSTERAPWHVVPADHKWFTRLCVAALVVDELTRIDPRYPEISDAERHALVAARAELEAET